MRAYIPGRVGIWRREVADCGGEKAGDPVSPLGNGGFGEFEFEEVDVAEGVAGEYGFVAGQGTVAQVSVGGKGGR